MPRQPKVSKWKSASGKVYWRTQAGGKLRYLGLVDEMTFEQAQHALVDHLTEMRGEARIIGTPIAKRSLMRDAVGVYLEEKLEAGGTEQHVNELRRYLQDWGDFEIDGIPVKLREIDDFTDQDFRNFRIKLKSSLTRNASNSTVNRHLSYCRSFYKWAASQDSTSTYQIKKTRLTSIKPFPVDRAVLDEDTLPSPEEVKQIIEWAGADTRTIHNDGTNGKRKGTRRSPTKKEMDRSESSPFRPYQDMIKLLFHLGARPEEIFELRPNQVSLNRRQIVLNKHKNATRKREFAPRTITLNEESVKILSRCIKGKAANDLIFTTTVGTPWETSAFDHRFRVVRKLAGVREHIVPYLFRHLWITEALRHVPIHQVAKMCGTSTQTIERHYHHFLKDTAKDAMDQMTELRKQKY